VKYHCENLSCVEHCPCPEKIRGFKTKEEIKRYQYDYTNSEQLPDNLILGTCPRFGDFPYVIDEIKLNSEDYKIAYW